MKDVICVYNKKKYFNVDCHKNVIELVSNIQEDNTYKKAKDVRGNIMAGIFCKKVSIAEVEELYSVEYWVIYKGLRFEPLGIGKVQLENDRIYIHTEDRSLAMQYGFSRHDKMDYEKKLLLSEVEKLIIEKEWLAGSNKGKKIEREENIISFLKEYPDNI